MKIRGVIWGVNQLIEKCVNLLMSFCEIVFLFFPGKRCDHLTLFFLTKLTLAYSWRLTSTMSPSDIYWIQILGQKIAEKSSLNIEID